MSTLTFFSPFEPCAQTSTALHQRSCTHHLCNSHNIPGIGPWKRLLGSFKKVIKLLYRTQEKYERKYGRLKILLQLTHTISPLQTMHMYVLPLLLLLLPLLMVHCLRHYTTLSKKTPTYPPKHKFNPYTPSPMQHQQFGKLKIYVGVWRKLKGFISNNKTAERWKKLLFLSVIIHVNDLVK